MASTSAPKKAFAKFRKLVQGLLSKTTSPPTVSSSGDDEKSGDINWEELDGFGLRETDYMYITKCSIGENLPQGNLVPYGNIEISPSSSVLNYGQGLFEGMKVYRREDGGIMLFRPEENAKRMQIGAERLLLQAPTIQQFIDAAKQTAIANKRWVPPHGKGSLYLRPLLIGSGPVLGLGPAPECTFLIYASPIGNFYKSGNAVNLFVEDKLHRASPGGTGGIKSITNYSPVFESVKQAKANGFDDVLFLDAESGKHVEEVSSCNIFILKGNVIATPITRGTILPGITRKSIMEIAKDFGYQVEERLIPVEEVLAADEVFCTGTAMVVTAVASVTYQEQRSEYKTGEESVSHQLRSTLIGIQTGIIEDKKGWTIRID